jgi:hypothetical protein
MSNRQQRRLFDRQLRKLIKIKGEYQELPEVM